MTCSGGDSAIAADLAARARRRPARARARDDRAARAHAARRGDRGQPARLHVAAVGRHGGAARADRGARRRPRGRAGARPVRRVRRPRADPRRGRRRACSPRRCPSCARRAGSPGCAARCSPRRRSPTTPDPERIAEIGAARRAATRRRARGARGEGSCCARRASPSCPGWTVSDEDAAVAAWRELGGAVALKRTGLRHKAVNGGLILDVDDEIAVKQAYRRLGGTVLVELMAAPGTELLVAVRRDGIVPVLVVGLGGVYTELLDTVAIVPLPVTRRAREGGAATRSASTPRRRRDARHQARRAAARTDRTEPRDRPRARARWRSTRWPTRRS